MPEFSHVGSDVLYILASIVGNIHFPTKNSKVDSNATTLEAFWTGQYIAIDNRNMAEISKFLLKEILEQIIFFFKWVFPEYYE